MNQEAEKLVGVLDSITSAFGETDWQDIYSHCTAGFNENASQRIRRLKTRLLPDGWAALVARSIGCQANLGEFASFAHVILCSESLLRSLAFALDDPIDTIIERLSTLSRRESHWENWEQCCTFIAHHLEMRIEIISLEQSGEHPNPPHLQHRIATVNPDGCEDDSPIMLVRFPSGRFGAFRKDKANHRHQIPPSANRKVWSSLVSGTGCPDDDEGQDIFGYVQFASNEIHNTLTQVEGNLPNEVNDGIANLLEEWKSDLMETGQALKQAGGKPLCVGFVGRTGVGKSSLINKLLFGTNNLLPTSAADSSVTAIPTVLQWGANDGYRVSVYRVSGITLINALLGIAVNDLGQKSLKNSKAWKHFARSFTQRTINVVQLKKAAIWLNENAENEGERSFAVLNLLFTSSEFTNVEEQRLRTTLETVREIVKGLYGSEAEALRPTTRIELTDTEEGNEMSFVTVRQMLHDIFNCEYIAPQYQCRNADFLEEIQITSNKILWPGTQIVDLPGTEDTDLLRDERAENYLSRCDKVMLCYSGKPVQETQRLINALVMGNTQRVTLVKMNAMNAESNEGPQISRGYFPSLSFSQDEEPQSLDQVVPLVLGVEDMEGQEFRESVEKYALQLDAQFSMEKALVGLISEGDDNDADMDAPMMFASALRKAWNMSTIGNRWRDICDSIVSTGIDADVTSSRMVRLEASGVAPIFRCLFELYRRKVDQAHEAELAVKELVQRSDGRWNQVSEEQVNLSAIEHEVAQAWDDGLPEVNSITTRVLEAVPADLKSRCESAIRHWCHSVGHPATLASSLSSGGEEVVQAVNYVLETHLANAFSDAISSYCRHVRDRILNLRRQLSRNDGELPQQLSVLPEPRRERLRQQLRQLLTNAAYNVKRVGENCSEGVHRVLHNYASRMLRQAIDACRQHNPYVYGAGIWQQLGNYEKMTDAFTAQCVGAIRDDVMSSVAHVVSRRLTSLSRALRIKRQRLLARIRTTSASFSAERLQELREHPIALRFRECTNVLRGQTVAPLSFEQPVDTWICPVTRELLVFPVQSRRNNNNVESPPVMEYECASMILNQPPHRHRWPTTQTGFSMNDLQPAIAQFHEMSGWLRSHAGQMWLETNPGEREEYVQRWREWVLSVREGFIEWQHLSDEPDWI